MGERDFQELCDQLRAFAQLHFTRPKGDTLPTTTPAHFEGAARTRPGSSDSR